MTVNKGSLVSGRVAVTDYANLTADRYQFLGLTQAEPNLGPGANNTVLVITTNNTRSWSNSLTLTGNVSANYFIGNGSLLTGIFTTITNQTFQGDGSTVAFTLQQTATAVSILVTVNGITQTPDVDYLVISNILTFTTAPANADVIQVRFLSNNSVSGTYSNADVAAFLPTYSGNISAGNISATGNIQGQYILGNGAFLTGISGGGGGNSNIIYNGTSNVSVPIANGNVYINTDDGTGARWVFDINGQLVLPRSLPGNSSITTTPGTNQNIVLHPDGTGQLILKGDNSQLFSITSDTENQLTAMIIKSFGNTLGNAGGGSYLGSYLRPGSTMQTGDRLVAVAGRGSYDGVNYANISVGRMQIIAGGTWTANSHPTYISFLNTPAGSTSQVENLRIEPNGNVTIYNGNVISKGAYIIGYDGFGTDAVYAGVSGFTLLGSNVIAQFAGNVDSYAQINFQNISNSASASTDYIVTADNGDDTTYFADFGIASSNHTDPEFFGDTGTTNDAYLYVVGVDQAGTTTGSGNLILGSTNGQIKMFVGNTAQANVVQTVSSDGISVTGNIYTSHGSFIGPADVKGNGTMLTGGTGNLTSVTSFYADAPGVYSTCLTANPDGTLNITTYGNGTGQLGQWTFSSANLLLASQNVSGNAGESALLAGTRKIVNGQYSGAAYGYSAELAAGGTPSVAYTASNEYVQSVRLTFAVESVGTNPQWEQFDVVATKSLDTAGTVNFVVSNRIKARASIADTVVTATVNLANEIEISLNLDAGQTSGWSSFDAVEFGVMFN
jgi:hypothetical protein